MSEEGAKIANEDGSRTTIERDKHGDWEVVRHNPDGSTKFGPQIGGNHELHLIVRQLRGTGTSLELRGAKEQP